MFVALKIIPTIATIDTRRPFVIYNFDAPSSALVSTLTTHRTPEGISANALEKPGATAAQAVIVPDPTIGNANVGTQPRTTIKIKDRNTATIRSQVRFLADERNISTWRLDILRLFPNPLLSGSLLQDS